LWWKKGQRIFDGKIYLLDLFMNHFSTFCCNWLKAIYSRTFLGIHKDWSNLMFELGQNFRNTYTDKFILGQIFDKVYWIKVKAKVKFVCCQVQNWNWIRWGGKRMSIIWDFFSTITNYGYILSKKSHILFWSDYF